MIEINQKLKTMIRKSDPYNVSPKKVNNW